MLLSLLAVVTFVTIVQKNVSYQNTLHQGGVPKVCHNFSLQQTHTLHKITLFSLLSLMG